MVKYVGEKQSWKVTEYSNSSVKMSCVLLEYFQKDMHGWHCKHIEPLTYFIKVVKDISLPNDTET